MRLADIMVSSVYTVTPDTPADKAYEFMRLHTCHHLVVVREHQVVGIVSDRDLGSRNGALLRAGHSVAELMSAPVTSGTPSMTMRQAANLMRGHSIGCLPVLDHGELVGIVTVSDLLHAIGGGMARPTAESKRWVMKGRGPRRKPHMEAHPLTGHTGSRASSRPRGAGPAVKAVRRDRRGLADR